MEMNCPEDSSLDRAPFRMADDLFVGLPPPSAAAVAPEQPKVASSGRDSSSSPAPAPAPALKSALKRDKPAESPLEGALYFLAFSFEILPLF